MCDDIFFYISFLLYSKIVILLSLVNELSTAILWEFLASENILENLLRAGIKADLEGLANGLLSTSIMMPLFTSVDFGCINLKLQSIIYIKIVS